MYDPISKAILSFLIFLSVIILIANTFTVFVFWIHRNKLKRTFLLVVNLTVADLLVGFTGIVMLPGTSDVPQLTGQDKISHKSYHSTSAFFHSVFLTSSVFFLVLISLERAFALIWPLRHRIASTKIYIYSVVIIWLAGIALGALSLLVKYAILKPVYYVVGFSVTIYFSLVTICVSYVSIRRRINNRNPAIETAHNKESVEQNTKLSKTFFIVIAASITFWATSVTMHSVNVLCPSLFPQFLSSIFTILHMTNSLVNPIIYSLRIPVFRKTFKQFKNKMKIFKRSI